MINKLSQPQQELEENRLRDMSFDLGVLGIGRGIEQLPAWLAWGVPLAYYISPLDKAPLNTPVLMLKQKLAKHNNSGDMYWSLMHS
jgi:hypothetical protein